MVLLSDELHELVVDVGAEGLEEAGTGGELMEEEELLLLTESAVVVLASLLLELLPLLQQLGVGEGDTVDTLKSIVVRRTEPVAGRVLGDGEALHATRVGQMGTHTEINEGATLVDGGEGAIGDLGADDGDLEGVVLKDVEGVLLCADEALEGLLLADDLLGLLGDLGAFGITNSLGAHEGIVVEAVLEGRTNAELDTVASLESLTENVGAGVPEHLLASEVLELEEGELAVTLELSGEIPELTLFLRDRSIQRPRHTSSSQQQCSSSSSMPQTASDFTEAS